MSQPQILKIPRASDRKIVEAFEAVSNGRGHISISSGMGLGFVELGILDFKTGPKGEWEALLEQNSTLLQYCTMSTGPLSISYYRGGIGDAQGKKSAIFDEIHISLTGSSSSRHPIEQLNTAITLSEKLNSFDPERVVSTSVSEEARNIEALHQMRLERLEKISADLIEKNTEFRRELEKAHHQKLEKLDLDFENRKESLDAEYKKRDEALELERQKLVAKLASVDDRDNTHVRREIRDRMLNDVKNQIQNFGVSKATSAKRRPIATAIGFLIAILLVFLMQNLLEFESFQGSTFHPKVEANSKANMGSVPSTPNASIKQADMAITSAQGETVFYLLWVRIILLSLGLIGTILYYIRWQNKWAEQHATAEFQLRQFYIDINRVNWVIESC